MRKSVLLLLFLSSSAVAFTQDEVKVTKMKLKDIEVLKISNTLITDPEFPLSMVIEDGIVEFRESHGIVIFTAEVEEGDYDFDPNGYGLMESNVAVVLFREKTPVIQEPVFANDEAYEYMNFPEGIHLFQIQNQIVTNIYFVLDDEKFMDILLGEPEEKSSKAPKVDEKYISVDFLERFRGLYPHEVKMNTVVYPNGDKIEAREGLLFLDKDGANFMITLGIKPQLYARYNFYSHPDLGNIISMQVFFETEVAGITAKNNKVVDYKVIGKLKPGAYAIPLDNKGCNKGVFRINLPNNQLEYWYFQLEDCTLSPNIIKESSTRFDYK